MKATVGPELLDEEEVDESAKKLVIKTVVIYSVPDARSVHVQMFDETYCVDPASSTELYLNMENIIEIMKMTGSQCTQDTVSCPS